MLDHGTIIRQEFVVPAKAIAERELSGHRDLADTALSVGNVVFDVVETALMFDTECCDLVSVDHEFLDPRQTDTVRSNGDFNETDDHIQVLEPHQR